jgi:endonuclease/exonuclease/phosphatase family metal-dependent hydrolase
MVTLKLKNFITASILFALAGFSVLACSGCMAADSEDASASPGAAESTNTAELPNGAESPNAGMSVEGERSTANDFTVVAYNVENLFDVDGVAMFGDYAIEDESEPLSYSRRKFQTKLENIAAAMKTFNDGACPAIILFQELEADFTPESTVEDFEAFLSAHAGQSLGDMLGAEWREHYAGYPSHAWLLKALTDAGLTGYEIAVSPAYGMDSGIAHANAVFSKYPINDSALHRLEQARDIVEAQIDVQGHPLTVYVNHWKSGASNPDREPIRVENARVLRELIDAKRAEDPNADIIVAGDLNSHYNQAQLFPDIETGINGILGSSGAEDFSQSDLYNLWFELPPEERYAEVWRGNRGTLMHMLVSPGLYDETGISYIDGSFEKLLLPGLNVDAVGRPLRWTFAGETGGGSTDHLPIYARFKVGPFLQIDPFSQGDDAPDAELPLTLSTFEGDYDAPDGRFLNDLSDTELVPYVGKLFTVDAVVESLRPMRIRVGDRLWHAYYGDSSIFDPDGLPNYIENHEGRVRLIVQPNFYRGQNQLIIEKIVGPSH